MITLNEFFDLVYKSNIIITDDKGTLLYDDSQCSVAHTKRKEIFKNLGDRKVIGIEAAANTKYPLIYCQIK